MDEFVNVEMFLVCLIVAVSCVVVMGAIALIIFIVVEMEERAIRRRLRQRRTQADQKRVEAAVRVARLRDQKRREKERLAYESSDELSSHIWKEFLNER